MKLPPQKYLLGGIGAAVALFLLSRKSGDGTALPKPAGPIDPWAPRDTARAGECDPVAKPGVLAFREWALARWGQRDGSPQNIVRACAEKPDEHQEGRAWDLMTTGLEHGQKIVDELTANDGELARRAGIMYLIWNREMWRAYPHAGMASGSWAPYSGASPHTDHIHFSFSRAGAAGQTSLYSALGGVANV